MCVISTTLKIIYFLLTPTTTHCYHQPGPSNNPHWRLKPKTKSMSNKIKTANTTTTKPKPPHSTHLMDDPKTTAMTIPKQLSRQTLTIHHSHDKHWQSTLATTTTTKTKSSNTSANNPHPSNNKHFHHPNVKQWLNLTMTSDNNPMMREIRSDSKEVRERRVNNKWKKWYRCCYRNVYI